MKTDVKNSTFAWTFGRSALAGGGAALMLALGICLNLVANAHAARSERFVSPESFWVMCTSDWGNVAYLEMYAACRAYVSGVADVLAEGQAVGNVKACISEEATKGQATEAVIAWMRAHPERKELTAVQITAAALAQKYPCH